MRYELIIKQAPGSNGLSTIDTAKHHLERDVNFALSEGAELAGSPVISISETDRYSSVLLAQAVIYTEEVKP